MKLFVLLFLLLSCLTANAQQPATTTSYEIISSVDDLQKQSHITFATLGDDGGMYVCSTVNGFYLDPVSDPEIEAVLFGLVYDEISNVYFFKYEDKYLYLTDAGSISLTSDFEKATRFSVTINDDKAAVIAPYDKKNFTFQASGSGGYYTLKAYDKTIRAIYLCKAVTQLMNAPEITVDGSKVAITADEGCSIKYQLISQKGVDAQSDVDDWYDWSPEHFAAEIAKHTDDVLLRAKAVYGQYESPVAEVLIKADSITGILDITTDTESSYYDLRGFRISDINDAAPGVYLRRRGTKTTKVAKP